MSTSPTPPDKPTENTYILDPESAAEMSRLLDQDHLLTKGMGSLFPSDFDLTNTQRVLDVACGPAGWALEIAFAHTDIEVIGVDISDTMISYANAQAHIQRLSNASFQIMNVLQGLKFPDASFDFINARFLVGFMPRAAWPPLLQECLRILRPGGTLRLTEFDEPGTTNSPAFEYWKDLTFQAIKQAGMMASPDGHNFGIMAQLNRMLKVAGCENVQCQAYAIDFSAGTDAFEAMYQNCTVAFKLVQPFLQKMNVAPPEELDHYYQQMLLEMIHPDFCAIWHYMSVWGQKPRSLQ